MSITIADTTMTDPGKVVSKSIIPLETPNLPERGSMMAALLESGINDVVWCLFYEFGGDWTAFDDGAEYDPERIDDWMPDAIDAAVSELSSIFGDPSMADPVAEDLSWFTDWAANARTTLADVVRKAAD